MRAAIRAWSARLTMIVAVVAASASVSGYISSGHNWASNVVLYYVNTNSTQLSAAATIAAIQEAAAVWTAQTLANVQLTYAGTTGGTSLTLNGRNEVFFRNDSPGFAVGETYWWYDGSGHLVDADIVFHEGGTRFYTVAGCTDGVYLEDLAVHEFGHALGLEHSPVPTATMYAVMPGLCDRSQLTLDGDDIAGIESMYPGGSTSRPPSPPSSLSASAAGTTSMNLTWADGSNNESGFFLERSQDGSSFSRIATLSANATSYNDGLLSSGTTYYYRITAYNGAGQSSYSNVASGRTTAASVSAPAAPSNLQLSTTSTSVTLTWTDNATNESGVNIYASENGSAFWQLTSVGAGATTFTWNGLRAGTSYAFRVAAYNGAGVSGYSNTASGVVGSQVSQPAPAAPGVPGSPSSLQLSSTSSTLTLTWADGSSNETGFSIEVSENGSPFWQLTSVGAGITVYTWNGPRTGIPYSFRVAAYNNAGTSAYSNTVTGQTGGQSVQPPPTAPGVPSAPTNLQFSSSTSTITLAWTDNSSNETGFNIYVSENGSPFWQLTSVGAGATTYTWNGARTNIPYSFRIAAFNNSGTSSYSNTVSGQTGGQTAQPAPPVSGAPAAPINLQFSSTSTSVTLVWTDASSNETGFQIYASENGSPFWNLTSVGAGATTFTWNGLKAGTPYSFRVAAYNGAGVSSYSNTTSGVVGGQSSQQSSAPGAPSAPANLQFSSTSTSVTLVWTDTSSNETGFSIEASESGSAFWQLTTVGAGRTSFTWSGLRPGTPYAFRVTAYNSFGTSGYSNTAVGQTASQSGQVAAPVVSVTGSTSGAPAAPTDLQVSTTATSVTLTWTDTSSDETGFAIYASESGSQFWLLTTVGAGRTSFTWNGLRSGVPYAFQVAALNGSGESALSNLATGVTGR